MYDFEQRELRPTTVSLRADLLERLRELAREAERSLSAQVRVAVAEHLAHKERGH